MKHAPRKLFPTHAAELANKLLNALGGGGLVARFVDCYAAEFNRPGLKAHPARYRELLATIGREVLLAMAAQVQVELPRYLARRPGSSGRRRAALPSGAQIQAAEAFHEEFLAALARALRWSAADANEFRRDLALCRRLAARTQAVKRRRKPTDPPEGPFVDRCALLLDPSLLEKARGAAGKFLAEIERVAAKSLAGILRRRAR